MSPIFPFLSAMGVSGIGAGIAMLIVGYYGIRGIYTSTNESSNETKRSAFWRDGKYPTGGLFRRIVERRKGKMLPGSDVLFADIPVLSTDSLVEKIQNGEDISQVSGFYPKTAISDMEAQIEGAQASLHPLEKKYEDEKLKASEAYETQVDTIPKLRPFQLFKYEANNLDVDTQNSAADLEKKRSRLNGALGQLEKFAEEDPRVQQIIKKGKWNRLFTAISGFRLRDATRKYRDKLVNRRDPSISNRSAVGRMLSRFPGKSDQKSARFSR